MGARASSTLGRPVPVTGAAGAMGRGCCIRALHQFWGGVPAIGAAVCKQGNAAWACCVGSGGGTPGTGAAICWGGGLLASAASAPW